MKDISQLSDEELEAIAGSQSSFGKTIGQGIAGIPAGIASIADLPAAALNLGLWGAEKIGKKLGASPDFKTPTIPYYAHDAVTELTNQIVGKPENNQEEIARTVGNIGGALINPTSLAGKAVQSSSKIAPSTKLNAFKDAGITPTFGEISNSRPAMIAEEGLKRAPGSSGVYENALARRDKELEDLFSRHGGLEKAVPISGAGEIVQKGAKAYNDKAKTIANKLYDKAWSNIDSKAKVPLNNTLTAIDEALTAITPQAREILQKSTSGKSLIQLENAIKANGGSLPVSDLKKVYRKDIDDLISSWGQIGTSEQGVLKNIRNALDAETKQFVIASNPSSAKDFAKADKFWGNFSERNKKLANKISSQNDPIQSFNESFSALKKGDAGKAKVLFQRLPKDDKATLSSTYINELGRSANGEFSADKWAREYTKLRPESQKVLTEGLPKESSNKLNSIAEALQYSKISKGQANHSGTAYTGILLGTGAGLLHSPIQTIATLGGAYGLSKLFTNPKFIDAVYAAGKAKTPESLNKVINHYKKVLPTIAALKEESSKSSEIKQSLQNLSDEELERIINSQ